MSTEQAQIPVAAIVARFGGIPALAEWMNVPLSMVQSWVLRDAMPADRADDLRAAAAAAGVELGDLAEIETVTAPDPVPVAPADAAPAPATEPEPAPEAAPDPAPEAAGSDAKVMARGGIRGWFGGLFAADQGARPITMIVVFAVLAVVGAFAWSSVIGGRAADEAAAEAAAEASAAEEVAQEAAPEPVPEPEPEPEPEPVEEAVAPNPPPAEDVAAVAPVPEPAPEPASEPAPEPAPEPMVETVDETSGEPEVERAAAPPAGEPDAEPVAATVAPDAEHGGPAVEPGGSAATGVADLGLAPPADASMTAELFALRQALLEIQANQAASGQSVTALVPRLDTLEAGLEAAAAGLDAAVAARSQEVANLGRALGVALVAGRIGAALHSGSAYRADLERLRVMGPDDDTMAAPLAALEPGSAATLPSDLALVGRFARLSPELIEATRVAAETGFFGRVWARVSSLVTVRRVTPDEIDDVTGDLTGDLDPIRTIGGIRARLEAGDLAGALELADRLSEGLAGEAVPEGFAVWLAGARARHEADQAVAAIEDLALDMLAAAGAP